MALQLQQRVSQHQECLSDLRKQFTQSRTHQFLFQRGDLEACPRILQERADELKAWNGDVGRSQQGQDDTGSTSADSCLNEISRNLKLIKNLFDLDVGEQVIDSDQRLGVE